MYIVYDLNTNLIERTFMSDCPFEELPSSLRFMNSFFMKDSYDWIGVPDDTVTEINENGIENYKVIDNKLVFEKPPAQVIPDPEEPPTDDTEDDNITVGDSALEYMINAKCEEINNTCHAAIIAGIDVETSYGLEHFSLTEDDQSNIQQWYGIAKTTNVNLPYHADDGDCKPYTNTDIIKIGSIATAHITHHTTYCNQLKKYVRSLTSVKDVYDVEYGVTQLTGEFLKKYETCMALLAVLN